MPEVPVTYRCACMVEEATVSVPERRDDEDVVAWVEGPMTQALALDHRRRSRNCRESKMDYAKIKLAPDSERIGQALRQN